MSSGELGTQDYSHNNEESYFEKAQKIKKKI